MKGFNRRLLFIISTVLMISTGCSTHTQVNNDAGYRHINQTTWYKSGGALYQAMDKSNIPENQANLLFVRAVDTNNLQYSVNIGIDGRFQTSLQDSHYSQVFQCAGTHHISVIPTGEKTNELDYSSKIVNLQPQKTYYFYVHVDENTGQTQVTQIDEESGRELLANKLQQTHQVSRPQPNCSIQALNPVLNKPVLNKP